MIAFDVLGMPAPKGSARAILIRGKARLLASGSTANQRAQAAWVKAVQEATRAALGERTDPLYPTGVPLEITFVFRLPRPKAHYGAKGLKPSAPLWHMQYPDADKLLRTTLDALTGLLYADDAQVPSPLPHKQWCEPGREGCGITVRRLDVALHQGALAL